MSVENGEVIDVAGRSKNNEIILTISDHLDWEDSESHLLMLQEKVNMYLSYIESDQILESYSDARDCVVVIKVVGKYELNGEAKKFYNDASEVISDAGFELRFTLYENNG